MCVVANGFIYAVVFLSEVVGEKNYFYLRVCLDFCCMHSLWIRLMSVIVSRTNLHSTERTRRKRTQTFRIRLAEFLNLNTK